MIEQRRNLHFGHLAVITAVLASGLVARADGFDPWTQPAEYKLTLSASLNDLASAKEDNVRIWVPLPAENAHQQVLAQTVDSPWPYRITSDAQGNRMLYLERPNNKATAGEIVLTFSVRRLPIMQAYNDRTESSPIGLLPSRYLGSQSRIPLKGRISKIAKRAAEGLRLESQKIRAFYDYVYENMSYKKEGEGWGKGDAIWACTAKYGNCTDFHSLLIGLARSERIPARFIIGYPIPQGKPSGELPGYHCWAEVFDAQRGWMPIDASEAWKSKQRDRYFGSIPSDRVAFALGRDLTLEPPQAGPPLNFFIYPYTEVNKKPNQSLQWKMLFQRGL